MTLRFHLPEHKRLVHEMTIDVRWGDMDALGHVNNTVYFRYAEMLRMEWLMTQCHGRIYDQGCGPVIVNAFVNFLRPVEYPAALRACHYVGAPGRSSVDTYFTLARVDSPGLICAEGGARLVWSDFKAGKSVPLPEALRVQLEDPGRPGS